MPELILFNKPFQVLSQFSDKQGRETLACYIKAPGFYPAGRLDFDSEGLLVLTDDGSLQARIAHPRSKMKKRYQLQLEGQVGAEFCESIRLGVQLKDGVTRPARATAISDPELWPRIPPVRQRKNDLTCWVEIELAEGRNRQLRRMCAALGFPVLRLVRQQVGDWSLGGLRPGQWSRIKVNLPRAGSRLGSGKKSRYRR